MDRSSAQGMLRIDGSAGEGGGQVLRTSLALSCAFGRPFEITNIRANRKHPGLQPQHLASVLAAASISGAAVEGAELSSTSLRFRPGAVRGGTYQFDVAERKGSAGSACLVLQSILLPLALAGQASSVTVKGGTHVPWSPSFHYLNVVLSPLLRRLGVLTTFSLGLWGWYPKGGGSVEALVQPGRTAGPIVLTDRGKLRGVSGISAVSNLSLHIAERQQARAVTILAGKGIDASIEVLSAPSPGKGSYLFLAAEFEHVTGGFDSLGAPGKRAEEVAEEACRALLSHVHARGALDPHLADQVIPWLLFGADTSDLTTSRVTSHLLTNIQVARMFTGCDIAVEGREGAEGRIRVRPDA